MTDRLAILISGRGSNMRSLIDALDDNFAGKYAGAEVSVVVSNNPQAAGLDYARERKIDTAVVDHRQFASRDAFDAALLDTLANQADWIALAGFMRILGPGFVSHFEGRMLNIHPSLLPNFPGLDTHQRAIAAQESHAGASVHYVTQQLDAGPVILQASEPILATDDADTLASRVLVKEHLIYPLALRWALEGRIELIRDDQKDNFYCKYQGARLWQPHQLDQLSVN